MKERPPAPELARRRPVWLALSELYLDTELEATDFRRIAAICAASGFAWHEIREINYDEVAPVLCQNFLSVAGEWAGWDDDWLTARIASSYTGTRHRLLGSAGIWRRWVDACTGAYLVAIAACLP